MTKSNAKSSTKSKGLAVRSKARRIADAAREKLAEDIVALDVRRAVSFADVFIVATGRSDRHVRAIADGITEALAQAGEKPLGIEGEQEARWLLMDFGDVIVHVFQPDVRLHYDLERLWSEASALDVSARAVRKSV
jgi:ribosome-associated protein